MSTSCERAVLLRSGSAEGLAGVLWNGCGSEKPDGGAGTGSPPRGTLRGAREVSRKY